MPLVLGEECDSIIVRVELVTQDVAKAHEKQIILGFRQVVNALVNVIPERASRATRTAVGGNSKQKSSWKSTGSGVTPPDQI